MISWLVGLQPIQSTLYFLNVQLKEEIPRRAPGNALKLRAMRLVQHLKTLLFITLLAFMASGVVNANVASGSQHLTLVGSDTPAGGLVGEDLESAITAGIQVERFNRQLHLKEAIALKGEKDRIEASDLSAAEKKARIDKLEAVSCHFVRCSEGVSEEDAGYEVLAERQAWGAQLAKDNDPAYQAIARHYHEGLFVYTDTDRINDFLTRHEEGVARTLGAGQSLTATIGTVGGVAFTVASAPTCPTSGVGCALTVGSVIFTGLEAARFIEGLSDIFGDYELSSGQKVLTSFDDPENHPGDVNSLGDVLKAAGISVVEVGVGKLLVRTSSGVRAVIDRFGGKKPRGDDVVKGADDTLQKIFQIQRNKGNFNIGSLTSDKATELGRSFVGPNAVNIVRKGKIIGFQSPDGLRQFRFPAKKLGGRAAGKTQANVEEFFVNAKGKRIKIRNAHIDIIQ